MDAPTIWPTAPIQSQPLRVIQNISLEFTGRSENLQSIIEIQTGKMTITLLSMQGQRLATLRYHQDELHTETHIQLPIKLPFTAILESIQLIYFPIEQLNSHLLSLDNKEWQITQKARVRTIVYQENLYGKIVYNSDKLWEGKTEYQNYPYQYRFIINSSLLP